MTINQIQPELDEPAVNVRTVYTRRRAGGQATIETFAVCLGPTLEINLGFGISTAGVRR